MKPKNLRSTISEFRRNWSPCSSFSWEIRYCPKSNEVRYFHEADIVPAFNDRVSPEYYGMSVDEATSIREWIENSIKVFDNREVCQWTDAYKSNPPLTMRDIEERLDRIGANYMREAVLEGVPFEDVIA